MRLTAEFSMGIHLYQQNLGATVLLCV